jgi:hypothetical protein
MRTGRPPKDPWERIMCKIIKNEITGCWEWTGSRHNTGYGQFEIKGKSVRVHRFSLERKLCRKLEQYEVTRHMCNNPPCCNPDHLEVGTQQDNVDDRTKAGVHKAKAPRGEKNWNAKLSDLQISEIRAFQGMYTQLELANMYGVHIVHISRIHNNRTRVND